MNVHRKNVCKNELNDEEMCVPKVYGQQKIFFANLKELLKSFGKLFYSFNISCLVFEIFRLEKGRSPPSWIFTKMHALRHKRDRAIFSFESDVIVSL